MLKYSNANTKTKQLYSVPELKPFLANKRKVYSLDLLSGWSCPFASDCLSKVVTIDGRNKIKDGPNTLFRCFSASQEVIYPAVYRSRKHNFDMLRNKNADMYNLLSRSMPKNLGICRIHVAGDMFSIGYFRAWMAMAANNPDRLFYAYTKSLKYWITELEYVAQLPNFILTASYGGRDDSLIEQHNLRSAKVIFADSDANGLDIDHDDSHAARPSLKQQSFALLLHGVQPAKSNASIALSKIKKANKLQKVS